MTRNQKIMLVCLTQQCRQHYRQIDVDFMFSYCDERATWMGAEQNKYIQIYGDGE